MPSSLSILHEKMTRLLADSAWRNSALTALDVVESGKAHFNCTDASGEEYAVPFLDVVWQTSRTRNDFLLSVYSAVLWQKILCGHFDIAVIPTSAGPKADDMPQDNQAILTAACVPWLKCGAKVVCRSTKQGADGEVIFDSNPFQRPECDVDMFGSEASAQIVFPLEIGYCMPTQIEVHRSLGGAFARFPYGAPFLFLFQEHT